jgi:integrase
MKKRFRLMRRGIRGGAFYCVDTHTGKRTSLGTTDEEAAEQILLAKNQAERQPILNLQIAKAYIAGTDSGITTRTWKDALDAITATKNGPTRDRWETAAKDKALRPLLPEVIIETKAETILSVIQQGKVSTNVYLRRLHNFCVDLNWLPWPIVPKRQWPPVHYREKRAIEWDEHCRIVEREKNPERKAFYQLAWHLGASQSDLANLKAEDIDWKDRTITFFRMKTKRRSQKPAQIRFGREAAEILATLPKKGPLFPYLATVRCGDRATEFKQRCVALKILGVTLHSYRYSWAERAKKAG